MGCIKIWVVAADGYNELVEALVKRINECPDVCAEALTVEQYASNAIEPTKENRLLLIGDGAENGGAIS